MIRNNILITVLGFAFLSLSGCTTLGVATGAAAVTGVAAAQEGGLKRAVSDATIKLKINEAWFSKDVDMFTKLKTKVNQGRVLITGVVQNPEHRVEAVRIAWQVDGVKQVINEIRVADSKGITGFVKDKYISSRLRTELTFNRDVQSINYSIDTVQGIIYLMGVAQNQAELNRVIETARTIGGVKQVVSYVKLAGEPLDTDSANTNDVVTAQEQPQELYQTNTNLKTAPLDPEDI
ncbi:MAG: BON domain-containing protein, partial [Pseudomonadota bacterium]